MCDYCPHTGLSKPECSCYNCTMEHLEAALPVHMEVVHHACIGGSRPKCAIRIRSPIEIARAEARAVLRNLSSDKSPANDGKLDK